MSRPTPNQNGNPGAKWFTTTTTRVVGRPQTGGDERASRVSLAPLAPEAALKALLATPAPPREAKSSH